MFLVYALACFAIRTRKEVANLTLFLKVPSFVRRFFLMFFFFLDDLKPVNFYCCTFNGDPVSAV